jgi:Arc/MetJ-type ribon-helix-helix transcriptional regulator
MADTKNAKIQMNIRVSPQLKKRIDEATETQGFLNSSELCRFAILEYLGRIEDDK